MSLFPRLVRVLGVSRSYFLSSFVLGHRSGPFVWCRALALALDDDETDLDLEFVYEFDRE